jgi:hypothetical protein
VHENNRLKFDVFVKRFCFLEICRSTRDFEWKIYEKYLFKQNVATKKRHNLIRLFSCCISDPESPPNKTIIFTKYRERHCVVVFPQVLLTIKSTTYLLRTLHADEGLNIRSEFLPDLTRIMKKTKMTLIIKYF